jgi:hypothetical protein
MVLMVVCLKRCAPRGDAPRFNEECYWHFSMLIVDISSQSTGLHLGLSAHSYSPGDLGQDSAAIVSWHQPYIILKQWSCSDGGDGISATLSISCPATLKLPDIPIDRASLLVHNM